MLDETEIKALRTHLNIVRGKIPERLYDMQVPMTAGEYMNLLINAQLSVINEILEEIDKEKDEGKKHKLLEEFEKLKGVRNV